MNSMEIIQFKGDPVIKILEEERRQEKVFYLTKESLEEIKSYSKLVSHPSIDNYNLGEIKIQGMSLRKVIDGKDKMGKPFPQTYILLAELVEPDEAVAVIFEIKAEDISYVIPKRGITALLKQI